MACSLRRDRAHGDDLGVHAEPRKADDTDLGTALLQLAASLAASTANAEFPR
jgi:hypothetical protein